ITSAIAASISGFIWRYWALRSTRGINTHYIDNQIDRKHHVACDKMVFGCLAASYGHAAVPTTVLIIGAEAHPDGGRGHPYCRFPDLRADPDRARHPRCPHPPGNPNNHSYL